MAVIKKIKYENAENVLHFAAQFTFIETGSSSSQCSETYPGAKPFSEPETLALAEFIKKFDTKLYLSFHSYSQLLLFPFVSILIHVT